MALDSSVLLPQGSEGKKLGPDFGKSETSSGAPAESQFQQLQDRNDPELCKNSSHAGDICVYVSVHTHKYIYIYIYIYVYIYTYRNTCIFSNKWEASNTYMLNSLYSVLQVRVKYYMTYVCVWTGTRLLEGPG